MRHATRALAALYLLASAGLLRCAIVSEQNGATGYGLFFTACVLLFACAVFHHAWHRDQLHTALARLEHAVRPPGPHEAAVADEIALGLQALAEACCLPAALTSGAERDPDHCTRKDQTT